MPLVELTTDDLDVAVLLFPPDWVTAFSVSHRFPGRVTAGQSGREGRRPEGEEIRFRIGLQLALEGDEAQTFRGVLATLGAGWVGVPLWCDARAKADWKTSRIYEAQRVLNYDPDTGEAVILNGPALAALNELAFSVVASLPMIAPLCIGHIVDLPGATAQTAEFGEFNLLVTEDSPWALRIGIAAEGVAGTFPADIRPDWSDTPKEQGRRALVFGQIGSQREQTIDGEESVFHWGQTAAFTLRDSAEVRTLLAFFVASEGLRKKFTCPAWFTPGTASAEAPHSTKVRFASDTLTLEYRDADAATCSVELVQVPWELVGVEGESPEQPPRVFLYKFTYRLPVPLVYRFTNWPRPLERAADGTYAPAPMLHRAIPDALDLRGDRVVLDSFHFAGNPLTLWHPDRIEAPMVLAIYEAESWPVDPGEAVLRFVGEVKRPKFTSRAIEAPVLFLPGLLEREFPRVRVGPSCNTTLFSSRCTLSRAAYLKAGTFSSAAGCVLTIATAAADAENAFALGEIEIGAGATWEKRHILASEPTGGGQLLTVDWPVRQAATGQAVAFVRGCPRTWEACQALGNANNFRGHPHIPRFNLSLPTMALPSAPGKK